MEKILLVLSKYHNRLYAKGIDYYNSLHEEQIDAFIIDKPELGAFEKFAEKIGFNKSIDAYFNDIKRELKQKICAYDKVVFFNVVFYEYPLIDEDTILSLQGKKARLLFLDSMKTANIDEDSLKAFEKIFSMEDQDIDYAKNKWNIDVEYITIGTNYNLYPINNDETKYDVCFVGITNDKRLQYLDEIASYCSKNDRKLFVSGHFWHDSNIFQSVVGELKFKKKHPVLYKYIHNQFIEPKDLANVYKQSKICLNINVDYHKSFNSRNFDVLYLGRLLITDTQHLDGIALEPGKDFLMCSDEKEMVSLIDKYLKDEAGRCQISSCGKNIVEKNYLFVHSLHRIINE